MGNFCTVDLPQRPAKKQKPKKGLCLLTEKKVTPPPQSAPSRLRVKISTNPLVCTSSALPTRINVPIGFDPAHADGAINSPLTPEPSERPLLTSSLVRVRPVAAPSPQVPNPAVVERRRLTKSEIAQHNTRTSMWIIVRGVVFDVTAFVSLHPGGASVISQFAGRDATELFNRQHGDSRSAWDRLNDFRVGEV